MSLAKKLKDLRENRNWTQQYLADVMNVDRSTISKYETGTSIPSYQTVIQLADIYNLEKEYLVAELDHLLSQSEKQPYILKESTDDPDLGLILQLLEEEPDLKNILLEIHLLEGNNRAFYIERSLYELRLARKKYKRRFL